MIKELVFLAQSDTTVGFLSKSQQLLNKVKQRATNKPCIICVAMQKDIPSRVPNKYKRYVRFSKKTTFILQNGLSFRVVKDKYHQKFIKKFKTLYSTSANLANLKFDYEFSCKNVDLLVQDERGFFESAPSRILKIVNKRVKKIR